MAETKATKADDKQEESTSGATEAAATKAATKAAVSKSTNLVEEEKAFEDRADAQKREAVARAAEGKLFGTGGTPGLSVDPEVQDKLTADREKAAGDLLSDGSKTASTEHFVATIAEVGGRPILSLSMRGWVGPAELTTHAGNLDEVIKVLTALK